MTLDEVIAAAAEFYDNRTVEQIKVSPAMHTWLLSAHPPDEHFTGQHYLWGVPVFIDPTLTGRTLAALDSDDNVIKTIEAA